MRVLRMVLQGEKEREGSGGTVAATGEAGGGS